MLVKQRDLEWDFIKCILMFLIIFGHLCPASESWTPVTRIIGLFVIPGFFFVSGYFQSCIRNFMDLIGKFRKTLMRIVAPMFTWGTIYVLVTLIIMINNGKIIDRNSLLQYLKYYPLYVAGIFWFLTALLFCIVIGSFLSWSIEISKEKGMIIALLTPFCFCMMSPVFIERYHFSFVWLFYLIGMLYKKTECFSIVSSNKEWSYLFLLFLFGVSIFIGVFFEPHYSFYYTDNTIGKSTFGFVVCRYLLYIAATGPVLYGLMAFYKRYKKAKIVHMLALMGSDTFFVYCSHVLVLVFVYRPFILPHLYHEEGNWYVRIMEHIEGLLASVVLYGLMQMLCSYCKQFKWMKVVFMGTN